MHLILMLRDDDVSELWMIYLIIFNYYPFENYYN